MKLSRNRILFILLCGIVIGAANWQVNTPKNGLVIREFERNGVPVTFMIEKGRELAPGVIVAHGFAGSRELMIQFGYHLARAGYAVALGDFGGHGANQNGLNDTDTLDEDLQAVFGVLIAQPEVDPAFLALVGHSMGSAAVLDVANQRPEVYDAVVAISPGRGNDVTPTQPSNVLLLAGQYELPFARHWSARLLESGGGESDNFAEGLARKRVVIPNVEHITILYSQQTHTEIVDWLNLASGRSEGSGYRDVRMGWYALNLLGWLGILWAIGPVFRSWFLIEEMQTQQKSRIPRWLIAMALSPLGAAMILGVSRFTGDINQLGGVLVGGALALWLFLMGVTWLLIVRNPSRPDLSSVLSGLAFFAGLTIAFGVMADDVWLPWWLTNARFVRWLVYVPACLPWSLALGMVLSDKGGKARLGVWVLQSGIFVAGLAALMYFVDKMGFLFLVLPTVPLLLGLVIFAGGTFRRPWAFATGNALFMAWIVAVLFPLV